MDATTLRIILFILGLIFLAIIYFYEIHRRKKELIQAKQREMPHAKTPVVDEYPEEKHPKEIKPTPFEKDQEDTWVTWDEEDTEPLKEDIASLKGIQINDDTVSEVTIESDDRRPILDQQELFSFSAREESPIDVPKLIIQINVKAKKGPFQGPEINKAMAETGLLIGKLRIYQRLNKTDKRHPQFNVASMVEPGIFPDKEIEAFTTPGLTLFTQLPVPGDSMAVFSDMLFTAERLAAILGGELQDETHSALTKQTIEHLRSQIMEHRRQVQLARSKA
jgi:cell division protein ZipA